MDNPEKLVTWGTQETSWGQPMLPVSQDCQFLIACSVFSNVCCPWLVFCVPYVASFSGLSISDCSFGILQQTLENTEQAIRNWQSRETGNIGYTRHKSRTTNVREYRTSNQKWFWLLVRYSLTFVVLDLCPVYPMLPVSQDCQFLIACSVFSNVCCPWLVSRTQVADNKH
jgi:hypothetical protein